MTNNHFTKRVVAIGEAMAEFSRLAKSEHWQRSFAGDAFNTAYYLSQLKGQGISAQFFSRAGSDPTSTEFLEFAELHGVDVDYVIRDDNCGMGLYSIDLDGAERYLSYWRDTSAARQLMSEPQDLDQVLKGADFVYLTGITMAIIGPNGRDILLDRLGEISRPILFDPNGAEEVVVKCGGNACVVATPESNYLIPARKVTPVDTTAAGDAFNAGYIALRLCGTDLQDAATFAHGLSSEVIQTHGALVELSTTIRTS